jgi:hypothetical protein
VRTVAALLLAGGLLVGLPRTAAAQESCNGDPATVVGTPGGSVVGTTDRDVVVTNGAASVDTLAGIDVVCVTGALPASLDGGDGRDRIVIALPGTFVRLDLGGSLGVGDATSTVAGFEDATVRAHSLNVDGTSGPNDLRWNACVGTVTGQRGSDGSSWAGGDNLCGPGEEHGVGVFGGGGKDRLSGSPWADILIGGRGYDRGDGRGGIDRCRVERPRNCELDR